MIYHKKILLGLFAVLMFSSAGMAQLRIGLVNPQTVLDALPEKAAVERRLIDYQGELQADLERRYIAFQQSAEAYQNRQSLMPVAQQREEETRLARVAAELQQVERGIPELIQRRQSELMRPVLVEMNAIIETIAIELKLDYIFNQQLAANQLPLLFIADASKTPTDITQRIIDQMKK
jgi:outer membrane protein